MPTRLLFDRAVSLAITGAERVVKEAFVAEARRQFRRVEDAAGPDGHLQFVDGMQGARLESVKPFGRIHFSFFYTRQIVEAALKLLEETSPVDSGEYVENHTIFIDSREATLDDTKLARRVVIANTTEYARVIEVGMGRHVPWSKQPQVPAEGVYKAAVRRLRRKFGHLADIRDSWVQGVGGAPGRLPALTIVRR